MRFSAWLRSKSIENEYLKSLLVICDILSKIANSSGSDQNLYVERMNNFQNSWQYEKFITSAVKRMITPAFAENERTWRAAAKKASKGKFLYGLLKDELEGSAKTIFDDQVAENVSLIRTLPNDVAQKVVNDIVDNALKGKRARSIEKIIKEQTDKHSRASARLIARTEVSKTTTAITKARSQILDIRWYVWRTALDGDRVRKSHRNMEGVLVSWSDPPSPESLVGEKDVGNYHAGNTWNCRCYPEPLVFIDDVSWPHKVYHQGRITMMKKSDFEKLM